MPRFLVVDDDAATVKALSRLLADDGHEVFPCGGAAEAVDALSQESFDAVVTDLEMPRLDGHAVVRAARRHQPDACVVVATAKAVENHQALAQAGACMIADKPFAYDEVVREIRDCRARGGPGAHGRCHMRSRPHGHDFVPLRKK